MAKEKTVAERWAKLAWKRARERAGHGGWDLLSSELRHALVCMQLVGILADQEHANGETMREAASIVLETHG